MLSKADMFLKATPTHALDRVILMLLQHVRERLLLILQPPLAYTTAARLSRGHPIICCRLYRTMLLLSPLALAMVLRRADAAAGGADLPANCTWSASQQGLVVCEGVPMYLIASALVAIICA